MVLQDSRSPAPLRGYVISISAEFPWQLTIGSARCGNSMAKFLNFNLSTGTELCTY